MKKGIVIGLIFGYIFLTNLPVYRSNISGGYINFTNEKSLLYGYTVWSDIPGDSWTKYEVDLQLPESDPIIVYYNLKEDK